MNASRRRTLAVLAWTCVGAWWSPEAGALEGGGARSIFAEGAGNRALAMGSAYVAVADDASGSMWNPGGLGRIPRFELQAGQTSYFALDLTEAYLAVAVPSWRWGTAAATFRRFGATGIEQRDDRNRLIEGSLDFEESELAFGYGRSLGEAWSVGGTLKARRQSLGGLSANGLGVDLGLQARPASLLGQSAAWLDGITWGAALHNLLEPTLRLDRESIADPRAVRSGLAYRRTLFGDRALLVALDLEKAPGAGTTLHTGVEFQLQSAFALRAGIKGGTVTAGTGFHWKGTSFDYVFEQHPIDDLHRFGLSYAFGRTTAERRELALKAEADNLQTRLAEEFQKRQAEQVVALLDRAASLIDERRFDEAFELVGTAQTIDPNDPRAVPLEVRCLKGKAVVLERAGQLAEAAATFGRALSIAPADSEAVDGERRCQAASDRRAARSADLRRQFAAAIDAFGTERWVDARDAFRRILATHPSDQEATGMLRRTEQAIARRAQELIGQSQRYIKARLFTEAAALLSQAGSLDPKAEGLAAASAALARAGAESPLAAQTEPRASMTSPATPAQVLRPALTAQQLKENELLYKRGLESIKHRRSDDALRYWELVWSADPAHANVAELLKKEYRTRGMESFAAGRLDEATGFWEKALQIDPQDARTIGYLARAQKQLARTREILGSTR